jgi:SAM-dependent methyltransferase
MGMNQARSARPDYGNWVPLKLIYVPGVLAVASLGLNLLHPAFLLGTAFFLACLVYFAYARYQFSHHGGRLQARIRNGVLDHLDWNGEGTALDIGCGNGPLTTALARQHPHAEVVGIDCWNGLWDYSKEACDQNAAAEGVGERVRFQKASAASLPFDDESFEAAVSNFVFHEIREVKDKTDLVKEALRVVKKGGKFCFQDVLAGGGSYGDPDQLLQAIGGWDVQEARYVDTSSADFIPRLLRNPIMVGSIGIICGTK